MKELQEKLILQEDTIKVRDINVGDIVGEFDSLEDAQKFIDDNKDNNYEIVEELKEDVDSLTLSGEEEIPEIESQDVVTIEEPSQEDVDNGMYNIISQEMRDTLQDIENLKSIITTLKANDESREDIIEGLETIIDERAVHVGMLQSMLDSFDEGTKQLIDQGRLTLEEPELVDIAKEEEVVDSNVDKLV